MESYYENGKVKSKLNFKNGNPSGSYENYYENGQLKNMGKFTN